MSAPNTRFSRPARLSTSSIPASARSNSSINRGCTRCAQTLLLDAQRFYENFLRRRRSGTPRAELAAARGPSVARIVSITGSAIDSVAQFQQAIALWESLVAGRPRDVTYQRNLAMTLNGLGMVLVYMDGRHDDAAHLSSHLGPSRSAHDGRPAVVNHYAAGPEQDPPKRLPASIRRRPTEAGHREHSAARWRFYRN